MNITKTWAMPNSNTFDIKPIKEFIEKNITGSVTVDPFANKNRIASVTNDIDPSMNCDYSMDALQFLQQIVTQTVDTLLFDPPYSPRQVSECYKKLGKTVDMKTTQASFWGDLKKEIARVVKPGGRVMCFGWNSGGVGVQHGFEMKEILLVAHGGWHNDTICTLEVKK